jgi:hypothetical protein
MEAHQKAMADVLKNVGGAHVQRAMVAISIAQQQHHQPRRTGSQSSGSQPHIAQAEMLAQDKQAKKDANEHMKALAPPDRVLEYMSRRHSRRAR